jgi:hypothetical protein
MAGIFDARPQRDVLTSVLNGVPLYKAAEQDDKRARQRLKRQRDKERKRQKRQEMKLAAESRALEQYSTDVASSSLANTPTTANVGTSSARTLIAPIAQPALAYWHDRPVINIASVQRSQSVTPPPPTSPLLDHAESTPVSTPGPSISSSTSRTSSKRPRTPDDDEDLLLNPLDSGRAPSPAPAPPPKKKRVAARKGWKGWVEGSPPPSEKLIQLDAAPILQERRTRSGKNFDAIGIGKDSWV